VKGEGVANGIGRIQGGIDPPIYTKQCYIFRTYHVKFAREDNYIVCPHKKMCVITLPVYHD